MVRSGRWVVYTPVVLIHDVYLVVGDRLYVVGAEDILGRLVDVYDGALHARLQRVERRGADEEQLFTGAVAPRLEMTERRDDVRRVVVRVIDPGGDDDRPDVRHRSGVLQHATDVVKARPTESVNRGVGRDRDFRPRRAVRVGHDYRPDVVAGDVTDPPTVSGRGLTLDNSVVCRAAFGRC